jgi:hypothetical protein
LEAFSLALLDALIVWHAPPFCAVCHSDLLTSVAALPLCSIGAVAAPAVVFWKRRRVRFKVMREFVHGCTHIMLFRLRNRPSATSQALAIQVVVDIRLHAARDIESYDAEPFAGQPWERQVHLHTTQ